jgi:hypothetical protein
MGETGTDGRKMLKISITRQMLIKMTRLVIRQVGRIDLSFSSFGMRKRANGNRGDGVGGIDTAGSETGDAIGEPGGKTGRVG